MTVRGYHTRKIFENLDAKSCILVTTCCEISCFLKTTIEQLWVPIHCWFPNVKVGGPVSPGPYGCCAYASLNFESPACENAARYLNSETNFISRDNRPMFLPSLVKLNPRTPVNRPAFLPFKTGYPQYLLPCFVTDSVQCLCKLCCVVCCKAINKPAFHCSLQRNGQHQSAVRFTDVYITVSFYIYVR